MPDRPPESRRIPPSAVRLSGASETRQLLAALVTLASELNATLELPALLRKIAEKAREVMNAERFDLLFLEGDTLKGWEDEPAASGRLVPLGRGVAGTVAATGSPLLVNDPAGDPRAAEAPGETDGARQMMCVPLLARGTLLGVAEVRNRRDGRRFEDDDLYLFQSFADMAAVALANARLHEDGVERRKLEREMAVALQIQRSLLPDPLPQAPGFRIEAYTEPAYHVGGDFYDVAPFKDGRFGLLVGDVSGKGASASLYMACLHSEFHVALDFVSDPAALLARLNDLMYARSRRGAFVSVLLLLVTPGKDRVEILSAGHPPPFLFRPETGRAEPVATRNGFPLGVMPRQTYAAVSVDLPPGAALLAFTDGATEARRADGEEFGEERLAAAFARAAAEGGALLPPLRTDIGAFTAGAPQYDDIALLSIRRDR